MNKLPLIVAGFVFAVVALLHLLRLYLQFPMTVNSVFVPLWINVIGLIVSALLSFWMFYSLKDE